MSNEKKTKAILVVSFGTSYENTRKKTIEAIEEEFAQKYSDYEIYRGWTSTMILKKIYSRDGLKIPTVTEAMEQMVKDGVKEVFVQPTHILNGVENDIMTEEIKRYQDSFTTIAFSTPLLNSTLDMKEVVSFVGKEFSFVGKDEALVFMGHGTTHYVNTVYAALDYVFKDLGHPNIFVGTVEAYPELESVLRHLDTFKPKKVYLTPFMIVAGDHAENDMAGEDEDSWKSLLEEKGYEVSCIMRGLGEYPEIRKLFLKHLEDILTASK